MDGGVSSELRRRIDELCLLGGPLRLSVHAVADGWAVRSELAGFSSTGSDIRTAVQGFRSALALAFAGTNPHLAHVPAPLRLEVLVHLRKLQYAAAREKSARRPRR